MPSEAKAIGRQSRNLFNPTASFTKRINFLETQGYTQWEHAVAVLKRPLTDTPAPNIPNGFRIRPLAGEQEVEAYVEIQRRLDDRIKSAN